MIKPKILYVDDELVNLMLFEANLGNKYTVLVADNGFTGLQLLSENSDIEVVVSDMKMPRMNGIEFIKKALEISPNIFFYIFTGFEITDEIQNALHDGIIQKYFKKPINMKIISSEIELILNKKKN